MWCSTTTCPLNEIIYDFFDTLKSRTRGYASLDYEVKGYPDAASWSSWTCCSTGRSATPLSLIVHEDRAYAERTEIHCGESSRRSFPRQMFEIPIQACNWRQDHRPGDGKGAAQGRAGQVLWRRHYPEEKAAGETEGR